MKCPLCGRAELVTGRRDLPYSYKDHDTIIKGVMGDHCPACDEFICGYDESARASGEMLAFNREVDRRT